MVRLLEERGDVTALLRKLGGAAAQPTLIGCSFAAGESAIMAALAKSSSNGLACSPRVAPTVK
ncbi:MAG: hypothetical protein ACREPV_12030 [Lysobacter sp.]